MICVISPAKPPPENSAMAIGIARTCPRRISTSTCAEALSGTTAAATRLAAVERMKSRRLMPPTYRHGRTPCRGRTLYCHGRA